MRFFKEKRNFHAEIEIFNLKIKKSSVKKKILKKGNLFILSFSNSILFFFLLKN